MKKILFRLIIVLIALFAIIQFFPIEFNPKKFDKTQGILTTENVPDSVSILLKNACYDCHSYETKFPWYAHVAPVSWLLKSHIQDGRSKMNLSNWDQYQLTEKVAIIGEIIGEVDAKEMPLKSYTLMHPKARLTDQQRQIIVDWATTMEKKLTKSN